MEGRTSSQHLSTMAKKYTEANHINKCAYERLWTVFEEAKFLNEIQTKVVKRFSRCYSQSPLHLCLEICYFFKLTNFYSSYSSVLMYTAKVKGGKPDKKS
jgi:hypothetical protein